MLDSPGGRNRIGPAFMRATVQAWDAALEAKGLAAGQHLPEAIGRAANSPARPPTTGCSPHSSLTRNRASVTGRSYAVLLGGGLRRDEAARLTFEHIQQRDGRWCIIDIVGKHGRPHRAHATVDQGRVRRLVGGGRRVRSVIQRGSGATGPFEPLPRPGVRHAPTQIFPARQQLTSPITPPRIPRLLHSPRESYVNTQETQNSRADRSIAPQWSPFPWPQNSRWSPSLLAEHPHPRLERPVSICPLAGGSELL
jgi:hypothetical protein